MVLNNKPQMFSIYFPSDFFYPEVKRKWEPIIERMKLPYQSIDDFMNSQIQSVTFPSITMETSQQQRGQYEVVYPGGKELEPTMSKDLSITFKLTESYISYFIMWDQIDMYLHYANMSNDIDEYIGGEKKVCWMKPIQLSFLTDQGFELTKFVFSEITPTSLSELNLSYAAQAASYNTFSLGLHFNVFDIK
jgi:hypothetical protein